MELNNKKGKFDYSKNSFVEDEKEKFRKEIEINSKLFYEKLISCKAIQLR